MDIRLTKQLIRNKILVRLGSQKQTSLYKKSHIIKNKLFRSQAFIKAKKVMFYKAFKGEVDTEEMIMHAQKLGKIVIVPVCRTDRTIMPCILHQDGKLLRGPYGIWEPANKNPVALKELDLVVVPGLAFTAKGKRLGRGKGYYDRFLKKIPRATPTIGLAFDFQVLPSIPTDADDVDVQKVIFA